MIGLMVVAMCALSASFVASASAEEPGEFLANGVLFTTALAATTEGELLFESLKTANATFLCSGIFDGEVVNEATGGLSLVTKVLRLDGTEVAESDTVGNLACTPDSGSICTTAAVSPVNLPWNSDVDLTPTTNDFLLLVLPNANNVLPGYFLLCEVFGLDNTELCELLSETEQLVENGVNDVVFPAGTSPSPDAHCSKDSASEESGGLVVDEALLFLNSGEALSVSE